MVMERSIHWVQNTDSPQGKGQNQSYEDRSSK